jgi:hypothetical protein
MPESTPRGDTFDASSLNNIPDPDVRRAMRRMHEHYECTIAKQQMEIEALLEMLLEKHIGSIGEYKRHLVRMQQKDARMTRLHDQIVSAARPAAAAHGH